MFSERLRLLRKKKHISQEQLAFDLNVARQTVSKWENGVCLPDTEKLMSLCQYFGCTSDYLLYDKQSEKEVKPEKRRIHRRKILMAVEIVCICVILCCSWMIPSKKEIHQIAEVRNEYTKEATEEEVTDVLECKAFVPFLKTYHLGILFIVLCSHLCVNLIFFVVQEGGKNEKEEMDG